MYGLRRTESASSVTEVLNNNIIETCETVACLLERNT